MNVQLGRRLAVLVLALAATGAAPARAATQIGQLPPVGASINSSASDTTWVQSTVGTVPVYAAPAAGVVTTWTTRGGAGNSQTLGMRLLRRDPADAAMFATVGATPLVAVAASTDNTFAVGPPGIAVAAGDVLALRTGPSGAANPLFTTPYSNDAVRISSGDGASILFGGELGGRRLNVIATVEPDADGDRLGDESQDDDDDNDGVADSADTCPATASADTTDLDGDGQADPCDEDDDADGLPDATEAALGSNARAADSDGDGRRDGADACPLLPAAGADGCPAPATPPPVADTTPPRIALAGVAAKLARAKFLRTGIRAKLTTSEPARLEIALLGRLSRAARIARAGDVVLAERMLPLGSGTRSATLKPAAGLRKALGRSLRLRLVIRARDAAGNQSQLTRSVAVR